MMRALFSKVLLLLLGLTSVLPAAESLSEIAQQGQAEARAAMAKLRNFRLSVAEQELPLEEEISRLRSELAQSRQELRKLREAADSNDIALAELESNLDQLSGANSAALSLLTELIEQQSQSVQHRLEPEMEERFNQWLSVEDSAEQVTRATALLSDLIDSLKQSIGGTTRPLTIYGADGRQITGTGLFIGPLTYFSDGHNLTGFVDDSDPTFPKLSPATSSESSNIRAIIENRSGLLPIDSTGGAALTLRQNSPDLLGEIQRSGIWIYPILIAAAVALVVVLVKSGSFLRISTSVRRARIQLPSVWKSDDPEVRQKFLRGQHRLLRPDWSTLWETRGSEQTSREDLLYARLIEVRLVLTRGLAALSVIAATAPLLGLLGTVTGMISTFQQITVFGTGDPQNLSGGISEALLTTKFGLVVAIPTFLLYAYLTRRAQGTVATLENFSRQFEVSSSTPAESSDSK